MARQAFNTPVPDEVWYHDRKQICQTCEFNSANAATGESLKVKTVKKLAKSQGADCDSVCTACFCCTAEKIKLKESVCGLIEIGQEPKWGAIEQRTEGKGVNMSVEVLPAHLGLLFAENKQFEYYIDTDQEVVQLALKTTSSSKIINAQVSCTCLLIESLEDKGDHQLLNFNINTKSFQKNVQVSRFITLTLEGSKSSIIFKLYITKR